MNYLSPAEYFHEKNRHPSAAETRQAQKASVPLRRNWWAEQLEQTRDAPAIREERNCHTQNWGV
jgi:hypothetical protein